MKAKKWKALLAALSIAVSCVTASAVVPAAVISVHAAEISDKKVELKVGDTYTLAMSGVSGKIKWKTKNASVATVDKTGQVTAIAPGSAKIIAKANGKKYKCKVTVTKASADPDVPVSALPDVNSFITAKGFDGEGYLWKCGTEDTLICANEEGTAIVCTKGFYGGWEVQVTTSGHNSEYSYIFISGYGQEARITRPLAGDKLRLDYGGDGNYYVSKTLCTEDLPRIMSWIVSHQTGGDLPFNDASYRLEEIK